MTAEQIRKAIRDSGLSMPNLDPSEGMRPRGCAITCTSEACNAGDSGCAESHCSVSDCDDSACQNNSCSAD